MTEVLVVDDEESICKGLRWILEKEGFNVTTIMDFKSAENIIKKEDYDIYFIDLVLPGGKGIDLIRLIKELDKKGIVIIITGYPSLPTLVDSIRLGTYDYLKKPFFQNELKKILGLIRTHLKDISSH